DACDNQRSEYCEKDRTDVQITLHALSFCMRNGSFAHCTTVVMKKPQEAQKGHVHPGLLVVTSLSSPQTRPHPHRVQRTGYGSAGSRLRNLRCSSGCEPTYPEPSKSLHRRKDKRKSIP